MASNRGRTGKQYTARSLALRWSGRPCCLCGNPIDPNLRAPHPWSHSVQHTVISVEHMEPGSDAMWAEWNTDSAHRRCNVIDGNLARQQPRLTTSREW